MSNLENAIQNLLNFNVESLSHFESLGQSGFHECIPIAKDVQNLYRLLPLSILDKLPRKFRQTLSDRVNNDYKTFSSLKEYNTSTYNHSTQGDFKGRFESMLDESSERLAPVFAYAVLLTGDYGRLEIEGRAKVEELVHELESRVQQASEISEQANGVLQDIKDTAALHGVTQQAIYFQEEAKEHLRISKWWRWGTFVMAFLIVAAAGGSLFLHTFAIFRPKTALDSYQLIASKLLLFAVLSYMLVLCARNFMSHKHNAVVNQHRQNALKTFRTLADAASDAKLKDVILTHASACIFSPQDTGYAKTTAMSSITGSKSVIELIQGVTKDGV